MSLRILNMMKKFGKLRNFKKKSKVVTDDFYQTGTESYTECSYYAVVIPARAYNIHSNLFLAIKDTGNEYVGIIDIYIDADTGLNVGDLYVDDDDVEYEIYSIEYWEVYQVLGAKRK